MADKNTSSAVHLTSLDLDINGIQQSLQQVRTEIEETANYVRQTMSNTLEGITINTSKDSGFGTKFKEESDKADEAITITKKNLESLYGQYLQLEKRIETFRVTNQENGTAFQQVSEAVQNALSVLESYRNTNEKIIEIAKEDEQAFTTAKDSVKELSNEIQVFDNALLKSGEALKNQIDKISGLTQKYNTFVASLGKQNLDSNSFTTLSQNATESANAMQRLYDSIDKEKGITQEQWNEFVRLAQALAEYRVELSRLQKEASTTGEGLKTITDGFKNQEKQITQLTNKYNDLLSSLNTKGFDENFAPFQNLKSDIEQGVNEVNQLYASMKNGTNTVEEQYQVYTRLQQKLDENDTTLRQLVSTARNTGEGLKQGADSGLVAFERLDLQYKNFLLTLSKSKLDTSSGSALSNIKTEARAAATEMEQLVSAVKNGQAPEKEQIAQLDSLSSRLNKLKGALADAETNARETGTGFKDMGNAAKEAGGTVSDFLLKLSDKAKWLAAYKLINMVYSAISQIPQAIIETENAVIELQRVMNEDIGASVISDELNKIAYDFGQSFQNVQETAVKFAQTGMEWNDVIAATRATMLGLNTAELEVSTATEGLIAVISQFNLNASDLQGVIDKINITADNFPVTSEKIVAALQRSGAAANAAGMSLEQTIGVITALSQATGRAGENIGTALNSIISFTTNQSALKTFEEFLGLSSGTLQGQNPLAVWKALGDEIKNNEEALAGMMAQSEEFANLFNAEIAEALDLTGQYNEALAHSEDVYAAAGTYRKTYFISLLNNIDTAIDAINNMSNATGYSLAENEKAMETFSKKWEQLVTSVRELAVQLGEAGLLDFMKKLADAATSVARLTKSFGGLRTAIFAAFTVLTLIKKQKIESVFNSIRTAIDLVKAAQNAYNTAMLLGYTRTEALKISMQTLGVSMGNLLSIFGLVMTIISGVTGKMEEARAEAKRLREEAIEAGKEAQQAAESLYNAFSAIQKSATNQPDSENVKQLFTSIGYSESDIAILIDRYHGLEEAIKAVTEAKYQDIKADAEAAKQAVKETISEFDVNEVASKYRSEFFTSDLYKLYDELKGIQTVTGDILETNEDVGKYFFKFLKDGIDDIGDARSAVTMLDAAMQELEKQLTTQELAENSAYQMLREYRKELGNMVEEYDLASGRVRMLGNSFEEYIENQRKANEKVEESVEKMKDGTAELYDFETVIKTLSDSFDDLSGRVDNFQSAYSTAVSVIEEYNETGYMTADMLQNLLKLEPEYLELLEVKNGKLQINQETLDKLIDTNDVYLQQMASLKAAEQAVAMAESLRAAIEQGLTFEQYQAQQANLDSLGSLQSVIQAHLAGAYSAEEFREQLHKLAIQMGLEGEYADAWVDAVDNTTQKIKDLLSGVEFGTLPTYWSKSSSAAKKETDKIKELNDAFNETITDYEHKIYLMEKNNKPAEAIANMYKELQDKVHAQAEKYRKMGLDDNSDYIQSLQKQWWKYQEQIEKIYTNIYNDSVKAFQNAISLLENQYDKVEGRDNTEGQIMNLEKQLEYQRKIQEAAHTEAERLRKLGVKENDDAVQACIKSWWSAEDAIQKINKQIEETTLSTYDDFIDLADTFDVWKNLDTSKLDVLKQKLAAINDLYKAGTISVQQYKKLIEETATAMYNAKKAELEQQKDDIQAYYDSVVEGYNAEIDRLKELQSESDDYYDSLIEKLREVEESNSRINEELDYYLDRQKLLTNIEQAQSRSGVEWREKEVEYQQQLAELDEDWRRKQEEWNISDQIDRIEKMKQAARDELEDSIKQIQEYIKQAEEEAKYALQSIDNTIEALAKKVYDSLQKGLNEGIGAVAGESTMNAATDIVTSLDEVKPLLVEKSNEIGTIIVDGVKATLIGDGGAVKEIASEWTNQFYTPVVADIQAIGNVMKQQLVSDGEIAAKSLMETFRTNFISPLKQEIQSVMILNMAAMQSYASRMSAMTSTYDYRTTNNNATTNLFANIPNVAIADTVTSDLADKIKFSTNPARR